MKKITVVTLVFALLIPLAGITQSKNTQVSKPVVTRTPAAVQITAKPVAAKAQAAAQATAKPVVTRTPAAVQTTVKPVATRTPAAVQITAKPVAAKAQAAAQTTAKPVAAKAQAATHASTKPVTTQTQPAGQAVAGVANQAWVEKINAWAQRYFPGTPGGTAGNTTNPAGQSAPATNPNVQTAPTSQKLIPGVKINSPVNVYTTTTNTSFGQKLPLYDQRCDELRQFIPYPLHPALIFTSGEPQEQYGRDVNTDVRLPLCEYIVNFLEHNIDAAASKLYEFQKILNILDISSMYALDDGFAKLFKYMVDKYHADQIDCDRFNAYLNPLLLSTDIILCTGLSQTYALITRHPEVGRLCREQDQRMDGPNLLIGGISAYNIETGMMETRNMACDKIKKCTKVSDGRGGFRDECEVTCRNVWESFWERAPSPFNMGVCCTLSELMKSNFVCTKGVLSCMAGAKSPANSVVDMLGATEGRGKGQNSGSNPLGTYFGVSGNQGNSQPYGMSPFGQGPSGTGQFKPGSSGEGLLGRYNPATNEYERLTDYMSPFNIPIQEIPGTQCHWGGSSGMGGFGGPRIRNSGECLLYASLNIMGANPASRLVECVARFAAEQRFEALTPRTQSLDGILDSDCLAGRPDTGSSSGKTYGKPYSEWSKNWGGSSKFGKYMGDVRDQFVRVLMGKLKDMAVKYGFKVNEATANNASSLDGPFNIYDPKDAAAVCGTSGRLGCYDPATNTIYMSSAAMGDPDKWEVYGHELGHRYNNKGLGLPEDADGFKKDGKTPTDLHEAMQNTLHDYETDIDKPEIAEMPTPDGVDYCSAQARRAAAHFSCVIGATGGSGMSQPPSAKTPTGGMSDLPAAGGTGMPDPEAPSYSGAPICSGFSVGGALGESCSEIAYCPETDLNCCGKALNRTLNGRIDPQCLIDGGPFCSPLPPMDNAASNPRSGLLPPIDNATGSPGSGPLPPSGGPSP